MEYIYSALLLHKAGKDVTADTVKAVLTAAGVTVDEARVKSLVAALDGVNIEEAIAKAGEGKEANEVDREGERTTRGLHGRFELK